LDAIKKVAADPGRFVYGISDHEVDGLQLTKPDASVVTVSSAALRAKVPPPFSKEPTGGGGVRMHHKFAVIDFDEPSARVYTGSYNFSGAADNDNGEQLLLIRDRRVAVSYAVEALRIFDHYHFRVAQQEARRAGKKLVLARPPTQPGVEPWWREHYTDIRKVRDRELFGG
jgi:phosphatidylserine/phosphatidylglycerophosphate/cardiolipin synthase-like enzyme